MQINDKQLDMMNFLIEQRIHLLKDMIKGSYIDIITRDIQEEIFELEQLKIDLNYK